MRYTISQAERYGLVINSGLFGVDRRLVLRGANYVEAQSIADTAVLAGIVAQLGIGREAF